MLKDLCTRLPYGVICRYDTVVPLLGEVLNNGELQEIKNRGKYFVVNGATCLYDDIKPYLRPMSSMTEEERSEWEFICSTSGYDINEGYIIEGLDWLNSHHFDFRNLIERGLAIDCTNLNIY